MFSRTANHYLFLLIISFTIYFHLITLFSKTLENLTTLETCQNNHDRIQYSFIIRAHIEFGTQIVNFL